LRGRISYMWIIAARTRTFSSPQIASTIFADPADVI
jgi:hypothetical protein